MDKTRGPRLHGYSYASGLFNVRVTPGKVRVTCRDCGEVQTWPLAEVAAKDAWVRAHTHPTLSLTQTSLGLTTSPSLWSATGEQGRQHHSKRERQD